MGTLSIEHILTQLLHIWVEKRLTVYFLSTPLPYQRDNSPIESEPFNILLWPSQVPSETMSES